MLQEIQLIPGQTSCVLMSTGYPPNDVVKTSIDKRAVPIAPAPDTYSHGNTSELMMCRKKINFKSNPYSGPQAVSIARRNARERNRVKQVNDGFSALRRHLPPAVVAALSNGARRGAGKKLSKVDTLRMVVEYIRYLQQLLDESDGSKVTYENEENVAYTAPAEHTFMYETSPCSEQAPSPSPSDSSSGVSSGYSFNTGYSAEHYEPHAPVHQDISPMDEDELLDVISWWQQK